MVFVDWFMASFLYCFPCSYRSFTLLKALAKSKGNLIANAFKSDNFRKEALKLKEFVPIKYKNFNSSYSKQIVFDMMKDKISFLYLSIY